MTAVIDAGYAYEFAGLVFYLFFLAMVRRGGRIRYAQHTRVLTIVAAIGLVGVVPFHYAHNALPLGGVLCIALAALASAFIDARAAQR